MMRIMMIVVALGVSFGLAGQVLAADKPESIIKYRQSVMKALGGHMKWYIPLVERHRLNGHLATLLLIGGSDLMYRAIALRSSPLRWLSPSSIAAAMRPSAAS